MGEFLTFFNTFPQILKTNDMKPMPFHKSHLIFKRFFTDGIKTPFARRNPHMMIGQYRHDITVPQPKNKTDAYNPQYNDQDNEQYKTTYYFNDPHTTLYFRQTFFDKGADCLIIRLACDTGQNIFHDTPHIFDRRGPAC